MLLQIGKLQLARGATQNKKVKLGGRTPTGHLAVIYKLQDCSYYDGRLRKLLKQRRINANHNCCLADLVDSTSIASAASWKISLQESECRKGCLASYICDCCCLEVPLGCSTDCEGA